MGTVVFAGEDSDNLLALRIHHRSWEQEKCGKVGFFCTTHHKWHKTTCVLYSTQVFMILLQTVAISFQHLRNKAVTISMASGCAPLVLTYCILFKPL